MKLVTVDDEELQAALLMIGLLDVCPGDHGFHLTVHGAIAMGMMLAAIGADDDLINRVADVAKEDLRTRGLGYDPQGGK
jgi:hypothetical protein